ncbi:branched-chain amino acid transport system II carrier protein [Clostridium chauvoei]|uniref:Branched-chain amino acid transport system carrier protein n=2 Tax=Clostridium chauvoei TaxID=46867 RepID=A0A1U6JKA8_9CLOT|nr:branched-chain amino acid transport system II carrier protein [Clostridium chauvoei]ATD55602.1 branched-chain amino acid transport system II carrier protein [Clostridium chauvoei]ATD56721.1 branched-chain amino acid transport system II carrier protein [Clostridium chauvoei]MBX7280973.1 branched-chain amino acid transport system II carrier protein [Clostridium chauvoei]MBX7283418.1 branched-chain amino acid transport system II carrier protein [Clostridium chauvoei]MBX7286005.1 branched-chain
MKGLSRKDLVLISLMLFSLFFGAGNLIFPPFLGQAAGTKTVIAMLGFFITAVGFPVLGVVVIAKSGGLYALAKRVNKTFAGVFTVLIYLSIGPCLGIPRAGSLPFEMAVSPYLPSNMSRALALFIFTLIFFAVAYWLSLSPSKLVDRMGKVLTPTLLSLVAIIFIAAIFKPLGGYAKPTGEYITSPFIKGFLEGYLTMDTIAALNFGIVISLAIKSRGVKDEKTVISTSIKAGIIAGILLIAIYSMLGHLGATSGGRFGATENGAQTLTNVMTYIFGKPGAVLLAVVFTLACLTTCVGLITSCSQYFTTLNNKVSYKAWVSLLALSSMLLANMGLTKILSISVPVLNAIYPIAIMLILVGIMNNLFKGSRVVYSTTILFTGVISVIDALEQVGFRLGFVTKLVDKLPFYSQGLGWVAPAILGLLLGIVIKEVREKMLAKNLELQE